MYMYVLYYIDHYYFSVRCIISEHAIKKESERHTQKHQGMKQNYIYEHVYLDNMWQEGGLQLQLQLQLQFLLYAQP